MLTPEQKAAYLADPNHCPYCGSDNLSDNSVDCRKSRGNRVEAECETCKKTWIDLYDDPGKVGHTGFITAIEEVQ